MSRCEDADRAGEHGIQVSRAVKSISTEAQASETVSTLLPVCVYRLHHLESKVMEDVGKPSEVVCELKSEVESFKRKLEVYVSVQKIQPQSFTRI